MQQWRQTEKNMEHGKMKSGLYRMYEVIVQKGCLVSPTLEIRTNRITII